MVNSYDLLWKKIVASKTLFSHLNVEDAMWLGNLNRKLLGFANSRMYSDRLDVLECQNEILMYIVAALLEMNDVE